ncbi:portal protein [Arthrobacter phage Nubia]|uniref:Portal and MuF-like fusion protein n=2 Tax=Korravirus TaxID=1982076 RepID=A0A3S9UCG5_9CAUD|nr:portal protein [Arthrobacter phage GreenHearts]YP_010050297.1 portal protein [Arthrobacter phage Nubia]ASR83740.1 portal and MuF-like fusion protein [Arthrobacter phage Nubia]AZS07985.1 portal and MuF-like fusion protein [Arthrobacter phage GreenHearts]
MGIFDNLRNALAPATQTDYGSVMLWGVPASFDDVRTLIRGQDPSSLYRSQPNLRTVISFMARNIAQLGVHTFKRLDDNDRKRDRASITAQTIKSPNRSQTTYELIYSLVADLALWDEAVWLVVEDIDRPSGWSIQPIPMPWVQGFGGGDIWGPAWVKVMTPGAVEAVKIPMKDVLYFHGWDPANLNKGVSPVEALKATMSEQVHAMIYREQQWTKAGRAGLVVTRPKEAPSWTPDQKRKFKEVLDSKLNGDSGADAGGSIIFEDGMEGKRLGFNAKEDQFIEAAKLSFQTVCQVYHINPTMVGQLDNANFSNVREFNKSLYTNTLGPILAQLEDRLNTFLVPKLDPGTDSLYIEFNIKEKLQGSFEEQAAVMSAAVGGPWMLRSEARSRENLPEIEGADQLIVPLNVVTGGQASPADSTPDSITGQNQYLPLAQKAQRDWGPVGILDLGEKGRGSDTIQSNIEKALKSFFKRQSAVVLTALGAKAGDEWWDEARWNRELAEDLYKLAVMVSHKIGRQVAEELGFDADTYDSERTLKFLQAVAKSRAEAINGATKAALDAALESTEDEDAPSPSDVFSKAEDNRSVTAAAALLTGWSAFATIEAAKQAPGEPEAKTKTWIVNSSNPRKAHSRMNGETVAVDAKFSNGADWPGDPVLGADGVAGCTCSVSVSVE